MAKRTTKSESDNSTNPILLSLLMLLIGAGGMFFYVTEVMIPKNDETKNKLSVEYAKVRKINDLYVFIEASPADPGSYSSLGIMEGENLVSVWNSLGVGKDKLGKVLSRLIDTGQDNLVFYEKLAKMTAKVKQQFPEASGIIFSDRMNKCEVIQFK